MFDLAGLAVIWSKYYLLIIVAVIFGLKMFMSSGKKFEEYPGNKVVSVTSNAVWNEILQNPENQGKLMIIDFYATWCPPCRYASPIYGRLSTEYDDILFLKVDVDVMRDLMNHSNVRAMPTFQLYRDSKQVDQVVGFDERKVKQMLEKHRHKASSAAAVATVEVEVAGSKDKAT